VSVQAWQPPRRIDAIDFWLRTRLLAAAHALRETLRPTARRWPADSHALADAPVLAQHRTPLWSDGRADEFPLVAGKVQNLRVARRAFDAVEVPAGEVLSFWRQLGRPAAWRGFVVGRELREGCVVPTLAGGLCQLSNALATVAARAGFELVEHHGHTARIEQADAADGDAVDATVFWNYVDLKLRAKHAWRLEVELTDSELVLRIRARAPSASAALPVVLRRANEEEGTSPALPLARGCLSCDQTACFRHRPRIDIAPQGLTAVLVDGWTPEFARYLRATHADAQRMQPVPLRLAFWRALAAGWRREPVAVGAPPAQSLWAVSLRRALWQRLWARHAGRRQASLIDGQRWLALAFAARLKPAHTQLVVEQSLLPHLQRIGALDGRRVTVLASALAMAEIERRLDAAAQCWPDDATLRDFRVDAVLVRAEAQALARAVAVVTPHADVARQLEKLAPRAVATRLDWVLPKANAKAVTVDLTAPPLVVFAASALARKGARELAAALQGWPCRLRVLGGPSDDARLWQGVGHVEHMNWQGDALAGARVVVLPAHIEHAPRATLRAVAAGVPVVASTACGLAGLPGVNEVVPGDVAALRAALQAACTP